MTTRVIKLKVLTSTNVVTINTNVRTFGEFKALPEVMNLDIDWSSAKLIDRATKASFELDEAVLPSVDCIMFHTPTKSKAGADWSQISYKECKTEIKRLKDSGVYIPFNYTQATTSDLQKFLGDYYFSNESSTLEDDEDFDGDDEVSILIETIQDLLNTLKSKVTSKMYINEEDCIDEEEIVVDMITVSDLEEEFDEIQRLLN